MTQSPLVYLKLGGSLITDKSRPMTPRPKVIRHLGHEIAQAIQDNPNLRLIIGHGSGSFGHAIASQYQTQSGGQGDAFWQGFSKVWFAARQLNQIVINHLFSEDLPVIAFPPSAGVIARNHTFESWDTRALQGALENGLIPVLAGDVIFDKTLGGTIFSTEEVFQALAETLPPDRILLAGLDTGVYLHPDQPDDIIRHFTPETFNEILPALSGAETADVTGGMLTKVQLMVGLVKKIPSLEVQIFSGTEPDNLQKALGGEHLGTLISC